MSELDARVYMKPIYTLRSILSYSKDWVPGKDKSNVVYKIGCRGCDASYVSETGRALRSHLSEHMGRQLRRRTFPALTCWSMHGAMTIRLTEKTSASLMLSPTTIRGWPGKRSTYAKMGAVCHTSTNWPSDLIPSRPHLMFINTQ